MIYIENIFVCLAIPLMLCMLFIGGRTRTFMLFMTAGMSVCLLSAYVNSFFMGHYGVSTTVAVIEITPVCEEVMKLLPLLFYILVFEPKVRDLPEAAIALAVGFATFENVCYLMENGAENFMFLLIRGLSAGALHILCGISIGFGLSYVFRRKWLAFTGTVGLLGACIVFHATYNLLITGDGGWRIAGYLFPSVLIALLYAGKLLLPRLKIMFE
ncbi:MAG: PrsW family intramembrane metalloprotease [Lachnospiraceae bacterium]|jgi:RsiW-degrading membrane proteinase PrsW (M82 family)|nr:PrsW family intramembrane metalloprotease [Lachnospiraceae bacterium]